MKIFKQAALAAAVSFALGLTACNSTGVGQSSTEVSDNAPVIKAQMNYVRSVEGIEEYQLENGLKVLLFNDAAQPKTLVNITYRVGSVHEEYGETGMAHLLEHMLFKGSSQYPNIDEEFKKRGMAINASTWLDRTNYFEVFDTNPESLEWALGMEADRMINSTFTEAELKSEMTVVRNEMERGENSPVRMLMSRMSSIGHLWHNYGNSTIGARSDVENFPFPVLREFYKKHYRPDNAVLTVAGRFDKAETIKWIEEKFGSITKPSKPIEALYTVEPTQDGERIVNLRRVGELPYVGLMYHIPSGLHPDAAAFEVLQQVLADSARGRLKTQMVENGVATMATAFSFLLKDSSQFYLIAQGESGKDSQAMEDALIAQAEAIAAQPITEQELKRAKTTLAKQSEMAMRSVQGVGMELSEYIAKGDYRHLFYFRDSIEQVTVEQVQAVADKYLVQSNRTLGRFIPTKDPKRADIPRPESLDDILKDYKGKAVAAAGEVYDNSVSNIKARLVDETWPQGTHFMVYPKKLRGEEIHINMHFPVGNLASLSGKKQAFEFIASQLKAGNQKYTKAEIADKLDLLKSSIGFSSSAGSFGVSLRTDKAHLDDAVAFVGELLSAPTFPDKELDIAIRANVSGLEQAKTDPSSLAMDNFRKTLTDYPDGHPYAYQSLDEKIAATKALTPEKLASAYRSHFDIKNGYIAVVGDVNSQKLSQQLQQILAPFTTDIDYQRLTKNLKPLQGQVISTETPDKANANVYMINRIDIKESHPDYLALNMANAIFGGDTFTSRIGKRIRVKEGYSYGVRSSLDVSETDEQGVFWAMAIAAPENMDKLMAAYLEEIDKVVKDGFTEDELTSVVEGYINTRKRRWAEDAGITGLLITAKDVDRDLAFYDEQIVAVKALTLEEVNAAFNKYIAAQKPNFFKAGDFAKVK